jgi:hypothetical protein
MSHLFFSLMGALILFGAQGLAIASEVDAISNPQARVQEIVSSHKCEVWGTEGLPLTKIDRTMVKQNGTVMFKVKEGFFSGSYLYIALWGTKDVTVQAAMGLSDSDDLDEDNILPLMISAPSSPKELGKFSAITYNEGKFLFSYRTFLTLVSDGRSYTLRCS